MRFRAIFWSTSLLVVFSGVVIGQVRKYSNEFMAIGVGGRSLGMSGSVVASVSDVTAGYWNPAGLTGVKGNIQAAAMHSEYFGGIAKYDFGALAYKIDTSSTIALSVVRFGVDGIPNTTDLIDAEGRINYDRITTFSAVDYGFILSYARKSTIPGLRLGINAKVINRKVGDMAKAWGFGMDAAIQYERGGWQLGVMARDITTTFNAWTYTFSDRMIEVWTLTGNEIPKNSVEITMPRIMLSAAHKHKFKAGVSIMGELGLDCTTDGRRNVVISADPVSVDPHMGLEAGYKDLVFLRAGIGNLQYELSEFGDRKNLTFQPALGIGLAIKSLSIDYAFTDVANQSAALYSHVISLKLDIYKK